MSAGHSSRQGLGILLSSGIGCETPFLVTFDVAVGTRRQEILGPTGGGDLVNLGLLPGRRTVFIWPSSSSLTTLLQL